MKIVLIHGQNHKGSSCHIGRMLADQFGDSEIREFFLPRDLNHFCVGCYRCIQDEESCPFYSEKKFIMDEVEEADLLIFTTPTYCLRASAPMKAFLDLTFTCWMSHKPRAAMFSKRAAVISTAAGTGARSAIRDVKTALTYWGVPQVLGYGMAVQAMGWEQISEKKKEQIRRDVDRLARRLSGEGPVRVGLKTKLLFEMMRMMQKQDWGASPEEKKYWQKNGWLDEKRPWR